MEFNELIDFLIRNRRGVVMLVSAAIAVFACWWAMKLVRRLGYVPDVRESLAGIPPLGEVPKHSSGPGDVGQPLTWIVALNTAYIKRAKALLGKIVGPIGLVVIVLIGGGLWLYDRNEEDIVTARLNFPDSQCKREHRDGAVIFIHGWTGDALETWKRYPELMCDDARYAAFEVVSVGYPTLMRSRGLTVSQIAEWMHEELRDQLKVTDGEKVIFVAHSMGGLVAREITLLHRLSQSPGNIAMLVEIGTPHNGARVARLAYALGLSKELTNHMLKASSTLKGSHVQWNQLDPRPETLCYSSPQDKAVSESSAFYQCDYQFSFPVWSHKEMVKPESRADDRYRLPTQQIARRLRLG